MPKDFDLVVIGAGSGGVAASRRAASYGARVLIAEADRVGGTCVIRGCVPKKLMMYAAGFSLALHEAERFGWNGAATAQFDLERWAQAKALEVDRLEQIYRSLLDESGVELAQARARLESDGTVQVGERRVSADRILIATGGSASRDALPGLELAMSSNEVLDLRTRPASMLVIGGGYIAVEFASIFAGMGTDVTLAFRDGWPLRGFDLDLRKRLAQALSARGVAIAAGTPLRSLQQAAKGFELHREDGTVLTGQSALNATGRHPNTSGIGLQAAGVRLDTRGAIAVDEDSRTSAEGIWAVGDVTGRKNLTPVAIAEGRAFADSQFGRQAVRVDHRTVASAVFTEPPLATVGLTEAQALEQGATDIYETEFRPMRTAFAGGSQRSYIKLVVDALNDRVLGIHMIGTDAPEIIQSLSVALTCGATKRDFDRTMAVHPTVAEEFMLLRQPARRFRAANSSGGRS